MRLKFSAFIRRTAPGSTRQCFTGVSMIRRLTRFACLFFLASTLAMGNSTASQPAGHDTAMEEEDQSFLELQKLLDEASEEAASTKSNADFVPGIITILRGDDLEERGMRTVYEALSLVPGLNLAMYPFGVKKIVVRGLSPAVGSVDMKLLLNDVPTNNALIGTTPGFYDIPVALVERIDIVRGTGAVIYGENASSGVINVITRKEGNRIYGRYGRYDTFDAGGVFSYAGPEKDFKMSLSLAGWDTDGADVAPGPRIDDKTGDTNENHEDITAIMSVDYKRFSLLGQYTSVQFGDYFGYFSSLPEPGDDRKVNSCDNMMLEARQELDLTQALKAKLKLGFVKYEQDWLGEMRHKHIVQYSENSSYEEKRIYGGIDFAWEGWKNQHWVLGMTFSNTEVVDASIEYWSESDDVYISQPGIDGQDRTIYSLFTQDEYEISDRLTLTMGLRFDHFSDLGDELTPRLALVYRLKDRHIFKAQYAKGYRTPTFFRKNGWGYGFSNKEGIPNDFEAIETYEFGYIYKNADTDGRITFFHSEIKDLKTYDYDRGGGGFAINTVESARMTGVELEFERQLTNTLKLNSNLSYVDTEYSNPNTSLSISRRDGLEIRGSANWLGNLGLIYTPWKDISMAADYHYVGKRHRWYDDYSRDKLDAYGTVDVTLNIRNFFRDNLTFRAGVKNLFNADVVDPSFHEVLYKDDLPRAGRNGWVQLSYIF